MVQAVTFIQRVLMLVAFDEKKSIFLRRILRTLIFIQSGITLLLSNSAVVQNEFLAFDPNTDSCFKQDSNTTFFISNLFVALLALTVYFSGVWNMYLFFQDRKLLQKPQRDSRRPTQSIGPATEMMKKKKRKQRQLDLILFLIFSNATLTIFTGFLIFFDTNTGWLKDKKLFQVHAEDYFLMLDAFITMSLSVIVCIRIRVRQVAARISAQGSTR